jgi:7-cyano-7-deazaguanine reductase
MSNDLTYLGREARIPANPDEAVLDTITAPNANHSYAVRFTCPEFTSLCPITGQPDFAHLVLDYVPKARIIESKSLKLYLASFRNHGAFHEAATTDIALRLVRELEPRWLRLAAFWFPRGGIPIDVFYQTGATPDGVFVPDPGVSPYRGRG